MQKKMNILWSAPDFNEDDKKAMIEVIESEWMSEGKYTKEFEKKICDYIGCKQAIVFNSATTAIMTGLLAHKIKANDEVVCPSFGFIAHVNVCLGLNANPLLCDSDKKTLNTTPSFIKKTQTKTGIKAIIPVNVAGMPVEQKEFEDFCEQEDIAFIEDSAESFGAEYKHKKIGSFNHASIFSFHIAKTFTTVEGGCITTKDKEIAERCRMIKNHGVSLGKTRTHFDYFGFNFRTTDLQSALGIQQLKRLDKFLEHRNKLAKIYFEEFESLINQNQIQLQKVDENIKHVWMFFPVLVDAQKRDLINRKLNEEGVGTRICWIPVHKQKYHQKLFGNLTIQNAEELGKRNIALPIGNGLSEEQIKHVCEVVKKTIKSV